MPCVQKSQLLRTFRTKRGLGRLNNDLVTLWTGSTVPQPSIFRDLEARGRLRTLSFLVEQVRDLLVRFLISRPGPGLPPQEDLLGLA